MTIYVLNQFEDLNALCSIHIIIHSIDRAQRERIRRQDFFEKTVDIQHLQEPDSIPNLSKGQYRQPLPIESTQQRFWFRHSFYHHKMHICSRTQSRTAYESRHMRPGKPPPLSPL